MKSERVKKALTRQNAMFKQLFGVRKETFFTMHRVLQKTFDAKHQCGGRPTKLSVGDKLLLALQYRREYRTMEHLAYEYDTHKSVICRSMTWVEDTLIKDGSFHLPGKKVLRENAESLEIIVVDVTESPIERPQKNKKSIIPARRSVIR